MTTEEQEKARRKEQTRSRHSRIADESVTAEHTINSSSVEGMKKWRKNPARSDVAGVDTKRSHPGKGWHETAVPTQTPTGIRKVAPRHHKVAIKKQLRGISRQAMVRQAPERQPSVRKVIREEKPEFKPIDVLKKEKTEKEEASVRAETKEEIQKLMEKADLERKEQYSRTKSLMYNPTTPTEKQLNTLGYYRDLWAAHKWKMGNDPQTD